MALINCPECGKEISSTVKKCPNCGYTVKKKSSKKILGIILIIVLILGIGGIVGYKMLIPQKQYSQAVQLLEQGKCDEANDIFSEIQDYKDVKELQEQAYYESIAYICVDEYKNKLLNPDSLSIKEISFYQGTNGKEFNDPDNQNKYDLYTERSKEYPICLINATYKNSSGESLESTAIIAYDLEKENYIFISQNSETYWLIDDPLRVENSSLINSISEHTELLLENYFNEVGTVNINRVKKAVKNNEFSTEMIINDK